MNILFDFTNKCIITAVNCRVLYFTECYQNMTRMLMSSKNDDNDDDNDELFEPAQNVVASFVE